MTSTHRISNLLVLALVAMLPFEFRVTAFGLSNLQWMFLVAAIATVPALFSHWRELARMRLVMAVGLLACFYWLSAIAAEEFTANAISGAVRVTAGLVLVVMAILYEDKRLLLRVWCGAAIAAAIYALAEYSGIVGSSLFRTEDFYLGTTQRLTASFEYPNTAAAFFAISLPLVWLVPARRTVRVGGTVLLWTALVLTYSRGAALAVILSYAGLWILKRRFSEWQPAVGFGIVAAAIFGLASMSAPLLVTRITSITSENPVSARYELEFTGLRQRPGVTDQASLTLVNDGEIPWPARGSSQVVLMSRWYDIELGSLLNSYRTETAITEDVPPGESLMLEADFLTPENAGDYLLIWDLRSGPDWFSRLRIAPAFAEVEIATGAARATDLRDLSHWTPRRESGPGLDAQVSRRTLWQAAFGVFLDHPFLGVGPDNFRLAYGAYLDYPRWDTNIRSNSLYLELLSTVGLAGLIAFLFVMSSIEWRWGPVSIGVGVFVLHGLVDVFLMTTPIYFAFWILAGLSRHSVHESHT